MKTLITILCTCALLISETTSAQKFTFYDDSNTANIYSSIYYADDGSYTDYTPINEVRCWLMEDTNHNISIKVTIKNMPYLDTSIDFKEVINGMKIYDGYDTERALVVAVFSLDDGVDLLSIIRGKSGTVVISCNELVRPNVLYRLLIEPK